MYMWILLAISFAVSSLGWIYFIYFFSIGYGLSISALMAATVIIFHDVLSLPVLVLCCVLFVYGIRLALYLFLREKRSATYKHILYQPENTVKKPVFVLLRTLMKFSVMHWMLMLHALNIVMPLRFLPKSSGSITGSDICSANSISSIAVFI